MRAYPHWRPHEERSSHSCLSHQSMLENKDQTFVVLVNRGCRIYLCGMLFEKLNEFTGGHLFYFIVNLGLPFPITNKRPLRCRCIAVEIGRGQIHVP